jgi:dihydroorotase
MNKHTKLWKTGVFEVPLKPIWLLRPSNLHGHLRYDGMNMLERVIEEASKWYEYYLVMPNAINEEGHFIYNAKSMLAYERRIEAVLQTQERAMKLLMTIYVNEATTPQMIYDAKQAGAIGGKVYPKDVTNGSNTGVLDHLSPNMLRVYEAMQECGLTLHLHGESPGSYYHDAEEDFLPTFRKIHRRLPSLQMVLEHLSTEAAVRQVMDLPEHIGATITPHHLLMTGNDVYRAELRPHNHCMPTIKRPEDRDALRYAIVQFAGTSTKLMKGNDSAPHLRHLKECAKCCAGCWNDTVSIPLYWDVLSKAGISVEDFERFASTNGPRFHGLQLPTDMISIVPEEWIVPQEIKGIVPYLAGETMRWKVQTA